eukprot:360557-Chlamydomonas_euryale.AAC.2
MVSAESPSELRVAGSPASAESESELRATRSPASAELESELRATRSPASAESESELRATRSTASAESESELRATRSTASAVSESELRATRSLASAVSESRVGSSTASAAWFRCRVGSVVSRRMAHLGKGPWYWQIWVWGGGTGRSVCVWGGTGSDASSPGSTAMTWRLNAHVNTTRCGVWGMRQCFKGTPQFYHPVVAT